MDPFEASYVRYEKARDEVQIRLANGIAVALPRTMIDELRRASAAQLATVEVQPDGDGITIRSLNVDISVAGLIADLLQPVFARRLGTKGGRKQSPAKAAAARKNGKKGGRPRRAA